MRRTEAWIEACLKRKYGAESGKQLRMNMMRDELLRLRDVVLPERKCPRCGRATRSFMCPRCRRSLWREFERSK